MEFPWNSDELFKFMIFILVDQFNILSKCVIFQNLNCNQNMILNKLRLFSFSCFLSRINACIKMSLSSASVQQTVWIWSHVWLWVDIICLPIWYYIFYLSINNTKYSQFWMFFESLFTLSKVPIDGERCVRFTSTNLENRSNKDVRLISFADSTTSDFY